MKRYKLIEGVKYACINPHYLEMAATDTGMDLIINLGQGQSLIIQISPQKYDELFVKVDLKDSTFRIVSEA